MDRTTPSNPCRWDLPREDLDNFMDGVVDDEDRESMTLEGESGTPPAGGGIPGEKGNMTDERIDPIGSVTPEPTCTECRRRPRWAGSLWCEPCHVRLGIMDGTAAFPMQWRGSGSRHRNLGDIP